jgi:hypothetical protein
MLLDCAQLCSRLGLTRRAALKLAREMDALPLEKNGRADFVTTERAVELWLTVRTVRRLAGELPLDPLKRAAVELALAAQLEHGPELAKLRSIAA